MLTELIRSAAATDLGLTVVQGAGWFPHLLPLAGSSAAQIGIILSAAVVVHEMALLAAAARKHMRRGKPRGGAAGK